MARIELESVEKIYPNGHVASRDLTLDIADGELLVLVGPSGCGKSTVLRLMAGLETPTRGTLRIGGRDVTRLPPQERDVAMVFQSYALYPHMTVRQNLGFGLRVRKRPQDEIARRVDRVAESLGLAALLERKPAQLSGGQRQRVALGRAIVREPQAFLLDEPLSNLDAKLRVETRAELSRLHRRLAATMVYVTHDQEEAMTLGDRVAVLREGVLQQVAPPMELYRRPANLFVAGFIGSPAMNFFEGALRREEGGCTFAGRGFAVPVAPREGAGDGAAVVLGVRPQEVLVANERAQDSGVVRAGGEGAQDPGVVRAGGEGAQDPGVVLPGADARGPGVVRAQVAVVEPIGSVQIVHCTTPGGERLVAVAPVDLVLAVEETAALRIPREAVHLFRAEDGARL